MLLKRNQNLSTNNNLLNQQWAIFWMTQRKFKYFIFTLTYKKNRFLFKLLHYKLPTFHQCAKYWPDIKAYKDLKYYFYNTKMETIMHFLTCSYNLNLNIMKTAILRKFRGKLKKRNTSLRKIVDTTIKLTEIMSDVYSL